MTDQLRIALISPKGPLYRRRGGIFSQTLRYMPLTLPTLAALVPEDVPAEVRCFDEGIEELPPDLDTDLVGLTVITGTAPRAYKLAAAFRAKGIPVVLGGPHVTLVPDDAQPHADSIVVGYAEEEWPRLLRDFVNGDLKKRYEQAPDLELDGYPLADRSVLPRWNTSLRTSSRRRARAYTAASSVSSPRLGVAANCRSQLRRSWKTCDVCGPGARSSSTST